VGIAAEIHQLPEDVSQEDLEQEVRRVCADPAMDGVLVQLPLPRHLDEEQVMEFLDPRKDVDGFHPLNMGYVSAVLW
jgi:methylenetetrahydrofolate dehydrogenase (NADP+)/methenyltetrahydrofolate cyclohydrolase